MIKQSIHKLMRASEKARNIIFILVILSGLFYWYQIRPSKIRHDCSWVRVTTPAIPAYPAMTEEELRDKGLLDTCKESETSIYDFITSCKYINEPIINEYFHSRDAIPEVTSWRKASADEYVFCLHDNGL